MSETDERRDTAESPPAEHADAPPDRDDGWDDASAERAGAETTRADEQVGETRDPEQTSAPPRGAEGGNRQSEDDGAPETPGARRDETDRTTLPEHEDPAAEQPSEPKTGGEADGWSDAHLTPEGQEPPRQTDGAPETAGARSNETDRTKLPEHQDAAGEQATEPEADAEDDGWSNGPIAEREHPASPDADARQSESHVPPEPEATEAASQAIEDTSEGSDRADADDTHPEGEGAEAQELTPEETTAINDYTKENARFDYKEINDALYGNAPMTPEIEDRAAKIDSGLEKLPPYEGLCFRRSRHGPPADAQPGDVYSSPGFVSSSRQLDRAETGFDGDYTYVLGSSGGRRIDHLSAHSSEDEVLFGRDSQWRIDRLVKHNGRTVVFATEVRR